MTGKTIVEMAAEKAAEKAAAKEAKEKAKAEAKQAKAAEKAEKKSLKEAGKAQEKADRKAKKDAEKAAKAEQRIARLAARDMNRMPAQNGIRRPKANTLCGKAWVIFDEVSQKNGAPASIGESMPLAKAQDLNDSTIRSQYARWRKFNGVTGRIEAPKQEVAAAE